MKKTYIGLGVVVLLVVAFFGANFYISSQTEKVLKDSLDSNGMLSYEKASCKSVFFNPTCVIENASTQGVIFKKVTARNVGGFKNVAEGKDGKGSFDFLFEGITFDPSHRLLPSKNSEEDYKALEEVFEKSNFSMVFKGNFEIKDKDIILIDPFVAKLQTNDIELSTKIKANEPNGIMKNPMAANFNYFGINVHVKNRDGLIDTLYQISSKVDPNRKFTKKEIKDDMDNFKPEILRPKNETEKKFANALANLVQGKKDSLSVEIEGNSLQSGFMMFQATHSLPEQYKVTIKN